MIPLTIGQYIKEESISQFINSKDHYELAFYGSDVDYPFIHHDVWYHGVMNAIKFSKKLAICYMREPAFAHDEHVEKQILLGHDLVKDGVPAHKIYYFYSTDLGKETHEVIAKKHNLKPKAFNIITFPYYEVDAYKKILEEKICEHVPPFEAKRKVAVRSFLSLNGKPDKFMRLRQIVLYWQRRLMNNGLITLTRTEEDIEKYPNLEDYYNEVKDLISKTDYDKLCKHWPHSLDEHNVKQGLYGKHFSGYPFDKKLYLDTYFSVVSETHSGAHNCNPQFFPTEKIYKAIINCHPFVALSTQNFLHNLKEQGYKSFSPFINEEYDQEPDAYKRMNLAIDQVEKLCKDGVPIDMFSNAIHNYTNLINRAETSIKLVEGIFNESTV
jgi:hypothetical protein